MFGNTKSDGNRGREPAERVQWNRYGADGNPSVPNVFTFASSTSGTATGGYLTSNNLQNFFVSYSSQRIDGTVTGKNSHFSDFVVTSVTNAPTTLTILAPAAAYGAPAPVTVTATSGNGTPTGPVVLTVDGGAPLTQPLSNGSTVFNLTGLTSGMHQLSVTYATVGVFLGNTATGTLTVNAPAPSAGLSTTSLNFGTLYLGAIQLQSVTLTNTGTAPMTVECPLPVRCGKWKLERVRCAQPLSEDSGSGQVMQHLRNLPCPDRITAANRNPGDHGQCSNSRQSVSLSANVINPQASFKPGSLSFGKQSVGTTSQSTVTLQQSRWNIADDLEHQYLWIESGRLQPDEYLSCIAGGWQELYVHG